MTLSLKNNGLKIDVFTLRQKGIYPLLETSDIATHSRVRIIQTETHYLGE